MAVSRALARLLRIRLLEEEQSRLALESAMAERNRLEHARLAAIERQRRGRGLVILSAHNGELPDRMAGMAETSFGAMRQVALTPRVLEAETVAAARREEFMGRRVERRQAETLVEEARSTDAEKDARRSQQDLDNAYGNVLYGREGVWESHTRMDEGAVSSGGPQPRESAPASET